MQRRDCDFLCIGGGLGGLAGAIRAHDLNLRTLILEKSDRVGGVAAYSGGVVWVPANHFMEAAGIADSVAQGERYLDWVNGEGQRHDDRLRRAYLDNGPAAIRYFTEEAAIEFAIDGDLDHYYPHASGSTKYGRTLEATVRGSELGPWQARSRQSPHLPLLGLTHREINEAGGDHEALTKLADLIAQRRASDFRTLGYGLAGAFMKAALVDRNIPIELGSPATALIQERGRVVGAIATIRGEVTHIYAERGVLVATGSYGNAEWAASLEGLPDLVEASPPVLDGDGLRLTDPTPAALVRAGQAFTALGFESPGECHPDTEVPLFRECFDSVGYPHSMIVNQDGHRFVDESYYGYCVPAVKEFDIHARRWRNFPCYLIVDDRFRRQYMLGSLYQPGDNWSADIPHAATIEELAGKLGIPQDQLAATVTRFNDGAREANDPDFGRGSLEFARLYNGDASYPNPNLGTIEEPPFWGVRLRLVGLGIYSLGLHIDGSGRTLTRDAEALPASTRPATRLRTWISPATSADSPADGTSSTRIWPRRTRRRSVRLGRAGRDDVRTRTLRW